MNIFFGLMTTVPVVLKLTGYIDWSWQLILAPVVCPLIVLGLMYLMSLIFINKKDRVQVPKPTKHTPITRKLLTK